MERLRLAIGTDDGRNFMGRHFGDAEFYEVFDLSPDGWEPVCRVTNDLDEEEGHADPKKAKGVVGILREQGVQVAVSKVYGPNIKRIKKKLVCVLVGHDDIDAGLDVLVKYYPEVVAEFEKGEERGFLDWRKR